MSNGLSKTFAFSPFYDNKQSKTYEDLTRRLTVCSVSLELEAKWQDCPLSLFNAAVGSDKIREQDVYFDPVIMMLMIRIHVGEQYMNWIDPEVKLPRSSSMFHYISRCLTKRGVKLIKDIFVDHPTVCFPFMLLHLTIQIAPRQKHCMQKGSFNFFFWVSFRFFWPFALRHVVGLSEPLLPLGNRKTPCCKLCQRYRWRHQWCRWLGRRHVAPRELRQQ